MKKVIMIFVAIFALIGCGNDDMDIHDDELAPYRYILPTMDVRIIPAEGGTWKLRNINETYTTIAKAVEIVADTFPDKDIIRGKYNDFLQESSGAWSYIPVEENGDTVKCGWVTVISHIPEDPYLPSWERGIQRKVVIEPNPNVEKRTMILVYRTEYSDSYIDQYDNHFSSKIIPLFQEGRE